MKITDLEVFTVFAFRTNFTFVRLSTDEGISGIGESTLEIKERSIEGALRELKDSLLGQDPFQIELIWHDLYRDAYWRGGPVLMSALSGIDQALWDIKGKYFGVPVYQLLGGMVRDRIRAYANGWFSGARTPRDFAEKAASAVAMGYTALKFDPFGSSYMEISMKELDYSLEKLQAVRDAVGPQVEIMVEGHGRFNVPAAVTIGRELEKIRGIAWFEEPIPPDDLAALKRVKDQVRVPIAAGERLYTRRPFLEIVETGAADFLQPDISHAGGISELCKIAAIAESRYIPFAPHNPSGPVACASTLQLAACIPNFSILELMAVDVPYRNQVTSEQLRLADGCLLVPDRPGLGLELLTENFVEYPYRPVALRHYRGTLTDIRPPEAVPYYEIVTDKPKKGVGDETNR
jgi:galactonate dehydratase